MPVNVINSITNNIFDFLLTTEFQKQDNPMRIFKGKKVGIAGRRGVSWFFETCRDRLWQWRQLRGDVRDGAAAELEQRDEAELKLLGVYLLKQNALMHCLITGA